MQKSVMMSLLETTEDRKSGREVRDINMEM